MARHDDQEHPILTEKQDQEQRGDNPPGSFGHTDRPSGDLGPDWQPSNVQGEAEELIRQISKEHRPRREDVYPYLVVRAHSPGDRGARPTWPAIPCWESPDIALIDAAYTGPFTPTQLVASPTAGRRYRVFVRVWNLGLLPAVGVHVRAWFVNPGFFGGDPGNPAYQPVLIGGSMVNLAARTDPAAMQVVELDRTWDIPSTLTGHECLMASVSCPLDPWGGTLDANHDRHVGQRNLTILAGADNAKDLLFTLGSAVTKAATLELVHGMAAVTPLLRAVLGKTKTEFGPPRAPSAKSLRRGVDIGVGRHLLTMFRTRAGWLVADSARVLALAVELGLLEPRLPRDRHPFAVPGATRELIERIGPERAEAVGVLLDGDPGEALAEGLARLWDLPELSARDLAVALSGDAPGAHLLRFAHRDPESREDGGYSLVVFG